MTLVHRVLNPKPIPTLDDYVRRFAGGTGLEAARAVTPEAVIDELDAAGLRGRGGAGFPTGRKWRTVRENLSSELAATVVVNAAEGEPGTFKDRSILRCNPYQVIEGALIAAHVVAADSIVVAVKRAFTVDTERVRAAIDEVKAAGWCDGVSLDLFEGPDEYLYGEETALLEVLDGRAPFPRIAPPFRRGVTEVVEHDEDATTGSGLSAHVEMAGSGADSLAPPALVDNVETLANVPKILERGAPWFRTEGTDQSPGTLVCTITGRVRTPGVGEVLMGTTLREAIEEIGGGSPRGNTITAVMPGASGAIIPAELLDTPLTYETMAAIGSGLGSGSYRVLDETTDPVAAVAGVSRFLAIESCGQCSPCKQDGLALADLLAKLADSQANDSDIATLRRRANTVAIGARCSLGRQQQDIVNGLLDVFPAAVEGHRTRSMPAAAPLPTAELLDLSSGAETIDERHASKQPDWSYDAVWAGEAPVERFTDHRHKDVEA
jgi:NADH-quinone oxidoreductase subunit F